MVEAQPFLQRRNRGWLAWPEERALIWLSTRVPNWLGPDRLTALGLAGAFVCFAGYVLAGWTAAGLWVVNLGLIVNWLGDSLDGRVARLKGIERPKYGFFLDQSVDAAAQFVFAFGLGLSGYLRLELAALGLAAYLMMMVHGMLRAAVTRVFTLATAGIGLTEVRCMFFTANVLMFFLPPWPFALGPLTITYTDILGVSWIAFHLGLFAWATLTSLSSLAGDPSDRGESR